MTLSKCSCGTYCADPEEVQKEIGACIDYIEKGTPVKRTPVKVITVCPICGEKSITGGAPDFDEFSDEMCVMVFGEDYSEKHKNLPIYQKLLLEECSKGEEEFTTYSSSKNGVVHLKRKEIDDS